MMLLMRAAPSMPMMMTVMAGVIDGRCGGELGGKWTKIGDGVMEFSLISRPRAAVARCSGRSNIVADLSASAVMAKAVPPMARRSSRIPATVCAGLGQQLTCCVGKPPTGVCLLPRATAPATGNRQVRGYSNLHGIQKRCLSLPSQLTVSLLFCSLAGTRYEYHNM